MRACVYICVCVTCTKRCEVCTCKFTWVSVWCVKRDGVQATYCSLLTQEIGQIIVIAWVVAILHQCFIINVLQRFIEAFLSHHRHIVDVFHTVCLLTGIWWVIHGLLHRYTRSESWCSVIMFVTICSNLRSARFCLSDAWLLDATGNEIRCLGCVYHFFNVFFFFKI